MTSPSQGKLIIAAGAGLYAAATVNGQMTLLMYNDAKCTITPPTCACEPDVQVPLASVGTAGTLPVAGLVSGVSGFFAGAAYNAVISETFCFSLVMKCTKGGTCP